MGNNAIEFCFAGFTCDESRFWLHLFTVLVGLFAVGYARWNIEIRRREENARNLHSLRESINFIYPRSKRIQGVLLGELELIIMDGYSLNIVCKAYENVLTMNGHAKAEALLKGMTFEQHILKQEWFQKKRKWENLKYKINKLLGSERSIWKHNVKSKP